MGLLDRVPSHFAKFVQTNSSTDKPQLQIFSEISAGSTPSFCWANASFCSN